MVHIGGNCNEFTVSAFFAVYGKGGRKMPENKRESLIYTVMMCFVMVLWMSLYNITMHMGTFNIETIKAGWIGFPFAYIVAICLDWFVVSDFAKRIAFNYFIKPDYSPLKKIIAISISIVVPMVIAMSLFGGIEACLNTGNWRSLFMIWVMNIPKNFIMALPFQLIIAGPLVRKIFRSVFPKGTILA